MIFENLYYLFTKLSSNSFIVNSIDLKGDVYDQGKTHAMLLLEGQFESFKFPIKFKHVSGKRHCDLVGTGWGVLFLISDRMKLILEENNLTGWKSFPVDIFDETGDKIQNLYHGFSIVGRSGSIDYKKSEVIERRLVSTGPLCKYYKGVYPDMDSWDGSDFFLPQNHWGIVITERVKKILTNHKLANIEFSNLADLEVGVETIL
ncbi:imm11 family protein [Mongoliitalea daihaiensis]|uniref:imm11 family protein n=1 Tax=Mongoliitalea daihaiensis TaxID=2782006 RepID=UPI001F249DB1|nr:DUF1629 domain-containing protein [Mongoliitalea daihaiensis]UJP65150.1 hypothetical protein IPZ59_00495 [Mongoliitalea daihaiensis]